MHRRLAAAGITVWFDRARLSPGCNWRGEIEAACEASRAVLPLLMPRWKLSEWTRYETYGAEHVIPLLAEGRWEDVSTPPLAPYQSHSLDVADDRLFAAIRDRIAQPPPQKAERVAHLPYRANPYFVGREETLIDIHQKLFTNPTAALTQGRVEAVTALGGVGKTTLARQYAEKFWRCYRQMFWVDCRQPLDSEFTAIHDILRPEPLYQALKPADKAQWARYELNQSAGRPLRLLIMDNAEDEQAVSGWIPRTGNCHTIITSRFTAWSPGIETCPVWVLPPEPARELLLRRSRKGAEESAACDEVAKKVGYLPLALEQAGAYVGEQDDGFGFADYLKLYADHEREFLARRAPGATEYPDAVYLTWRATIDKLPEGARTILRLCAFMASAPLPVSVFLKLGTEFDVREWKQALLAYSIANPAPSDPTAPRRAVERPSMAPSFRISLPFSAPKPPTWPPPARLFPAVPHRQLGAARLLPRAHARRTNWEKSDSRVRSDAEFLDALGGFLWSQGRYEAAEPLYRRALDVRERKLGPEHPNTLGTMGNLAMLLCAKGDYRAAEPLYQRALDALERVLGPEHPVTLTSVNSLAALLVQKGDYGTAEPLLRQALTAQERVLGREHPDTLGRLSNLAALLHAKRDYGAAEPLYRRALDASERVLGREHPDTLTSVSRLAVLLHAKGDYVAAEPLCRRVLAAQERVLGPDHPDTLTSVNDLAALLYAKGDYGVAEPLCRRALEARERVLGPDHPDTLRSVYTLALQLYVKGDYSTAETLYRRALEGRRRVLGESHPGTRLTARALEETLRRKAATIGPPARLKRWTLNRFSRSKP